MVQRQRCSQLAMYDVSFRQRARHCPVLNLSKPLMRILILALLAGTVSAPAMAQLMLPAQCRLHLVSLRATRDPEPAGRRHLP